MMTYIVMMVAIAGLFLGLYLVSRGELAVFFFVLALLFVLAAFSMRVCQ